MFARRALSLFSLVLLAGCASFPSGSPVRSVSPAALLALRGSVHGGQQPVSGASLQLYAVGLSGGGSSSTPLLSAPVLSDSNGGFTITNTYTCPTAASQVYIIAVGGNPGLGLSANNSAIALAASLGPCGNLGTSTFININEVTTVALANAVAPFYSSLASIGSLPADAVLLDAEFAEANLFASTSTGFSPGNSLPGITVPVAKINSLADILAGCVNSAGGVAGDGSVCGNLFSLTTAPGLAAPTDTFTAAVRLSENPSLNTVGLLNIESALAPFQPTLSAAPTDFSVKPSVASGLQASFVTAAFGQVNVGTVAAAETLMLSNTSGSSIMISSLVLSGISPGDFSETSSCFGVLAPGSFCTVQIEFSPLAAGRRVAVLAVNNTGPNAPVLIALSGIGVIPPAPTLTASNPALLTATGVSAPVVLTGTGFTSSTVVDVYGVAQPTTYLSPQALSFVMPASYLSSTGGIYVSVVNAGVTSNVLQIAVGYPAPTLSSISPTTVIAGSPYFVLTLNGSNIESTSTVQINGLAHTVYTGSGSGSVQVSVASSEVTAAGTLNVSVTTPSPGGGTSVSLPLQVIGTANRVRTLPYAAADLVADPVRTLLYASIGSTAASSPNSVVAIDPVQGLVVATQSVATSPGRIAVSDDGSYLYVSLPATAQIERFILPSLTPDITWSIGTAGAGDLAVAPGAPHTVAVSETAASPNQYERTLIIYDDGVARTLRPAVTYPTVSFDTLAWGADASTLYATNGVTSGGPEFVFSVNGSGPTLTNTFSGVFGSFLRRLVYDKTSARLYDGYGNVVNPANGLHVGMFNVQNTLSYEENPLVVDATGNRVYVLNTNYFNSSNTSVTADVQAFNLGTYSFINSLTFSGVSGSRIVRWGTAGLAIGGGSQVYLIDGAFVSTGGMDVSTGSYASVTPTITAVSPQAVTAGDGPVNVVITGRDFTSAAVATWNNQSLPVTWQSSSQITVTFPAALLTSAVASALSVTNGPGTESSNTVPFEVLPIISPNTQISAIGASGLEMAWDPTRGLIYVAVTSPMALYGNSIVSVDPSIPAIKAVTPTSYQPSTLGISDDGTYLYAGFQTLAAVNRYKLSDFSLNLSVPLNAGPTNQNFAGDVKVAPGQNQTFAVSMGTYTLEPRDTGGLAIYDDATPRPSQHPEGYPDAFKLAWGKDATVLFANSDPVFQPQGFSILSVNSNGFNGTIAAAGGLTDIGQRPHYDAGTNLVYTDGGRVANPSTGALVGQLGSSGNLVTDSTLNRVYVLRSNTSSAGYSLDIYNLTTLTLIQSISVPALSGSPTQILRWGPQGIAILTNGPGMLYLLQGSDISGLTSPVTGAISLNPTNLVVGSASGASVTVSGTGFLPGSTVLVDSVPQATTYVSPTQLTFQLNAAQGALARYMGVVVSNAASGGSGSPATTLEIDNAVPAITSLSPTSFPVGSSNSSAMLIGTGFTPSSVVQLNGTTITATYNGPTSLSVTIPNNYTSVAGSFNLTVSNPAPGGGMSPPASFTVNNPAPSITSLSVPNTLATGVAAQSIVIKGTGFLPSTVVQVNGTALTTTYSSASQISIALPGSYLSAPGTLLVTAVNPGPGGGASAPVTLTVSQYLPGPITLSPATITQGGSAPTTVTVTGTNFLPSSVVLFGGQSRTTTYLSPTQLTFVLTVADQAATGTFSINVVNPVPGGGTSPYANLQITTITGTPSISSVSPTQFYQYSGSSSIVVYATGITSSSTILWNGTPIEESIPAPQAGYITGLIQANLLSVVGTDNITVNTPGVTPPVSNAVSVSVVY